LQKFSSALGDLELRYRVLLFVFLLGVGRAFAQFPPQITRVVVIVQENRTPDNLFHFLTPTCPIPKGATGLSACTPYPVTSSCYDVSPCGLSNQKGSPIPISLKPASLSASVDPDHSHKGFNDMCDPDPVTSICRNDGAWKTSPSGASYAYVANTLVTNYNGENGHLLDPYLMLAEQYGWANYMFQTNQGPSYPAHQFIFSGTSSPTAADDANSIFLAENPDLKISSSQAGCLALANGTNALVSPVLGDPLPGCTLYANKSVQECEVKNTALAYPSNPVGTFCFSHQSMADVLDPRAITWKYYAMSAGFIWTAPDAIQAICRPAWIHPEGDPSSGLICTGKEWKANVDIDNLGTDILRDIANCDLASVNWVTPNGTWSDHVAPDGPSWVAAIVNAIGNNKTCPVGTKDDGQAYWKNTAIVITWDDWGGWSDNQPPLYASKLPCVSSNCPADYQLGFRVPLIVVSAYTPAGYIDNVPHDFGSILRMIQGINNLPEGELGFADMRSSTDLEEFFSLSQPRTFTTIPAEHDANFFLTYKGAAVDPDDD
jgi:phospholipase C